MTGDKHRGGSVQTLNWLHTTSISTAALFSCSLWRQYPIHIYGHIYGHGWTKATATVMISGDDLRIAVLLIQYHFALLPLFSTFVTDPMALQGYTETVDERGTTVPGRLTSVKYSNPSRSRIIWLLYCQIIATSHWSRHSVHFTVCASLNEGILGS